MDLVQGPDLAMDEAACRCLSGRSNRFRGASARIAHFVTAGFIFFFPPLISRVNCQRCHSPVPPCLHPSREKNIFIEKYNAAVCHCLPGWSRVILLCCSRLNFKTSCQILPLSFSFSKNKRGAKRHERNCSGKKSRYRC